jgi:hypothetical protein
MFGYTHFTSIELALGLGFEKHELGCLRKSIPILRICFHTTPCSNNFPCECIRNVQYSFILLHPFNREVEDNYLLVNLWIYLVGLSKNSNTLNLLKRIHIGNIESQDKTPIGKQKENLHDLRPLCSKT